MGLLPIWRSLVELPCPCWDCFLTSCPVPLFAFPPSLSFWILWRQRTGPFGYIRRKRMVGLKKTWIIVLERSLEIIQCNSLRARDYLQISLEIIPCDRWPSNFCLYHSCKRKPTRETCNSMEQFFGCFVKAGVAVHVFPKRATGEGVVAKRQVVLKTVLMKGPMASFLKRSPHWQLHFSVSLRTVALVSSEGLWVQNRKQTVLL